MKKEDAPVDGFHVLLRAHDLIWKDKANWEPRARMKACAILWERAVRCAEEKMKMGHIG